MSLFGSGPSSYALKRRAKRIADAETQRLQIIADKERANAEVRETEGEGFSEGAEIDLILDDDLEDDMKRFGQTNKRGTGLFI